MTDLPHHRAYGSVHGGSIASVQRLVQGKDTAISGLGESFIRNGMSEDAASGNRPISLAGIAVPIVLPFWHTKFHQVPDSRFRLLSLLPDVHPDPPAKPAVPFLHRFLHACDPSIDGRGALLGMMSVPFDFE